MANDSRTKIIICHHRTCVDLSFFDHPVYVYEVRRRSDTVVVLTINDANWRSAGVDLMTSRAASGKPKFLGSGGSMVGVSLRLCLAPGTWEGLAFAG